MIYLMYQKTNPCGIVSLILGIQAIITTCLPPVAIIFAIAAIILGIIGMTRKERQKGQAIAGLCCATAAFTINVGLLLVSIFATGLLASIAEAFEDMMYYW